MKYFLFILVFTATIQNLKSQSFQLGLLYGASQYKGDLADDNEGMYENLHTMKGLSLNYAINPKFTFAAAYISTTLSGDDKNSISVDRNKRNLHFRSDLQEFSTTLEIYPIAFFTKKSLWLKPFFRSGLGVFHFNPQAKYEDKWYDLQPMSTEGQGLPLSGKNPYYLFDISHIFGLGLKFDVGKISLKYEISPRSTNTDYIDDVSGTYFDLDVIRKYKSDAAAKLSYSAIDWSLENKSPDIANTQRGNSKNDDWFVIHQFSLTYTFDFKKKVVDAALPVEVPPVILEK